MTSVPRNSPIAGPAEAAGSSPPLDALCIRTLPFVAVDAVERAGSGPGLPLGASPMAYLLWARFLRPNPCDPAWPGREVYGWPMLTH